MPVPRDLSFFILSLGCAKNLVDSERVNGMLLGAGFNPAPSAREADIIIINTCGFIRPAKEESIEEIFEAVRIREASAHRTDDAGVKKLFKKKLAVIGCLTARYPGEIKKEIPEIDFLYGIPDFSFVQTLCRAFSIECSGCTAGARVPLPGGLPYSYVKISEGCSNNCSYCAIPLIRGPHVPASPASIVNDARRAAECGSGEIILVGQDTAAYDWQGRGISYLAEEISRISGVQWIRLLYCHPDHLTDEIIGAVADNEKMVHYLDIPFQHASGKILSSMGRKGNADAYLGLLERIRKKVPDIRIRSTFMVGYPGETEEDFSELLRFVADARIDRGGAFIFSPEEKTRALRLKKRVPQKVAARRHDEIMSVLAGLSGESLARMKGSVVRAVIEEKTGGKNFIGRTEYDAPEVDGIFYLTGKNVRLNSFVKAWVTGALEYDLIGEIM